jgi:purine-cytosine permease-like protein
MVQRGFGRALVEIFSSTILVRLFGLFTVERVGNSDWSYIASILSCITSTMLLFTLTFNRLQRLTNALYKDFLSLTSITRKSEQ